MFFSFTIPRQKKWKVLNISFPLKMFTIFGRFFSFFLFLVFTIIQKRISYYQPTFVPCFVCIGSITRHCGLLIICALGHVTCIGQLMFWKWLKFKLNSKSHIHPFINEWSKLHLVQDVFPIEFKPETKKSFW